MLNTPSFPNAEQKGFLGKNKELGGNVPVRKISLVKFVLLFTALFMAVGCGERNAKLPANDSKAFDGAPTELREAWDKALTAEKAKDYMAAQTAFLRLNQMTLSDQQRKTLDDERAAFGQRLTQAADKNDPAAIEALKMLIKDRGRR